MIHSAEAFLPTRLSSVLAASGNGDCIVLVTPQPVMMATALAARLGLHAVCPDDIPRAGAA